MYKGIISEQKQTKAYKQNRKINKHGENSAENYVILALSPGILLGQKENVHARLTLIRRDEILRVPPHQPPAQTLINSIKVAQILSTFASFLLLLYAQS